MFNLLEIKDFFSIHVQSNQQTITVSQCYQNSVRKFKIHLEFFYSGLRKKGRQPKISIQNKEHVNCLTIIKSIDHCKSPNYQENIFPHEYSPIDDLYKEFIKGT